MSLDPYRKLQPTPKSQKTIEMSLDPYRKLQPTPKSQKPTEMSLDPYRKLQPTPKSQKPTHIYIRTGSFFKVILLSVILWIEIQ